MSRFPVIVEQSRNRHSRAVFKDGTIVIRLARNLPRDIAQQHEESLRRRMERIAEREELRVPIDPFRPLLCGAVQHEVRLPHGTVSIGRTTVQRCRVSVKPAAWSVREDVRGPVLHRTLWTLAARTCLPAVKEEVRQINASTLRLPVRTVTLRYTRSQWGSCSGRGDISLSTALVFLPAHLRAYVIVHELAHLRYRGHGPRFWELVERAMPTFREAMQELKAYQVIAPE